jgi:hypothetical protein
MVRMPPGLPYIVTEILRGFPQYLVAKENVFFEILTNL